MATQLKLRRDTAANWTSANPTLALGEPGYESDTRQLKIGDGVNTWTTLPYLVDTSAFATLTGTQTLTNKTLTAPTINTPAVTNGTVTSALLTSPKEKVTISATAATGVIAYDSLTQADLYYTTNASANFTLNFRGNASTTLSSLLAVGESRTVIFRNTNGATPYYATAYQVDGVAVTPKWVGGTAPTAGNANSIDIYTINILKTAATPTYLVTASVAKTA